MRSRKYTFDQNAEAYRRYRPEYPSAIAAEVARIASLQRGARILEIGCGTGQATRLFSGVEPRQTSIDLGPNLIEQCERRFQGLPNYEFVCSSFEGYDGPSDEFDLVYAATSFHWLTPGVRFSKAAELLRTGGHLAVFSDAHTKSRDGFFVDVQECYRRHAPELSRVPVERRAEVDPGEEHPLTLSATREFDRDITYTADNYVGLLTTFSDHIALGEERLKSLCDSIHQLMSRRYDGVVNKTLTTHLMVYQLPGPQRVP